MHTFHTTNLLIQPVNNPSAADLHCLFGKVESQAWSLLFDTAGSTASNGRYNIMVWDPCVIITARNNQVQVKSEQLTCIENLAAKPLEVVKQYHQALTQSICIPPTLRQLASRLPFLVGAAGLLTYDLGRYYETLPELAESPYQCPDMAVGLYRRSLIEDTLTGVLYDCRTELDPPFDIDSWLAETPTKTPDFKLTSRWQSNFSKPDYLTALGRVQSYLRAGDCYQVNLAQRFSATYCGSEWAAYRLLQRANKAPFSAFMRLPESTLISISPERFIAVRDGRVETKPIKGTRPRKANPEDDAMSASELLNSEKDRAENLMIVDLLRNDLSKHCTPNSVKVPELFALESYAAVHHMVSTVEGQLNPADSPLDLLAGAFPGGSITGAPKVRAMEVIEELEPHRRNLYCGSMMYLGVKQDMDSSICIRTLLAENGHLYCWAGGGIVLDSDAESEYQETLDKVARILPVLEP